MRRVYNRIYDESIYKEVNPKNKELLDEFILDLRENRRSPETIKLYGYNLRNLFCYIYNKCENRFILELTKKDFKRYAIDLIEEYDLSVARRNNLIATLHSLLLYAEMDDDWNYDINPSRLIKSLSKEPIKPVVFLENSTVMNLFDKLVQEDELQKATVLLLAYDSAGRRNELRQVTKQSFLESNRYNTNIVVGKNRKKFSLLYFSKTKDIANEWLKQRGEDNIPELFIYDGIGKKYAANIDHIWQWFHYMRKYLSELNGKEEDFSTHSLRHSSLKNYKDGTHYMCKELGKDGFQLEQLQILAHHTSSETTRGYLPDTSNKELENMFGIQIQ